MHRYQILIEYVGTRFVGWQIQPKGQTVQKLIQKKLSKLLKEKIILIGSGKGVASVKTVDQIRWKRKSLKFYNILFKHYNLAINNCPKYK